MPMLLAALLLQATTTAAAAPPAKGGKDPNRMVCKDYTPIGSRIPGKRVCRTVAEWDAQRAADRDTLERSQSSKDMGRPQ